MLNTLAMDELTVYVKNQPYNQHLTIPRLTNWSELKEIVKEQAEKRESL